MVRAKVITVSDRCFRGEREDKSGPAVAELLRQAGYQTAEPGLVPDEMDQIAEALRSAAAEDFALIVTTGGTGFAPRDVTPEATIAVCTRPCGRPPCRSRPGPCSPERLPGFWTAA